jgi:FtsJ-like methyltransferase
MIGASLLRARAIEAWRPHAAPQASRALSSQWKQMRDADQYANMAIADGLRSRAAYKLLDIDKRFGRFLRQGAKVVDLGAAPGGFSVVAASRIHLDTEADRWDSPLRDVYAIPVPREPRELRRTIDGAQRRRKFGNVRWLDTAFSVC